MKMQRQVKKKTAGVIAPSQSRGELTHRKLIDATMQLLKQDVFEALKVTQITERAGVATGTFYRRFESKEALLPSLYEAYDELLVKWSKALRVDPAFEDPDFSSRMKALFKSVYALYTEHRGLVRALHVNSRLNPNIVGARSHNIRTGLIEAIELLLDDVIATDERKNRVARSISLFMLSVLSEQVLYPKFSPAATSSLSEQQVLDDLVLFATALVESNGQ
jgi:AcrR family transcriptional regulator